MGRQMQSVLDKELQKFDLICQNSYYCLLLIIYTLVHPCDKPTKGGCDQTCTKKGNEAVCVCKAPEFKLAADGKACEEGKNYVKTCFFLCNENAVHKIIKCPKVFDKKRGGLNRWWEQFQTVSGMRAFTGQVGQL